MINLNDFIVQSENSKSSRKLYRMTCDSCALDRGYQRRSRHGLGLCKSCAAAVTHRGKKYDVETKDKMRASHWTKNGFVHPMQGKKHSLESKAKMSISAVKQNKAYKGHFAYVGPKGIIHMKSSWEVKYADYLDSIGKSWVYEPNFILSSGYVYLPDFQLSTGDIIEIKGYMRSDAQVKWDLFCREHPELKKSLVTKVEMKQLKLIK